MPVSFFFSRLLFSFSCMMMMMVLMMARAWDCRSSARCWRIPRRGSTSSWPSRGFSSWRVRKSECCALSVDCLLSAECSCGADTCKCRGFSARTQSGCSRRERETEGQRERERERERQRERGGGAGRERYVLGKEHGEKASQHKKFLSSYLYNISVEVGESGPSRMDGCRERERERGGGGETLFVHLGKVFLSQSCSIVASQQGRRRV